MKTIYVVTAGEYSEYRVCGIFSTRENAEKYMRAFPKPGYSSYNDIEEYELDQYIREIDRGLLPFWIRMYRDGEVIEVRQEDFFGNNKEVHWMTGGYWGPKQPWANFYVWAKNREAAIKIANERRIKDLATLKE